MSEIKLEADLFAGVGAFISDRNEPPHGKLTLDEAVNMIVRDWLQGQGYMALPGGDVVRKVAAASGLPKDV